MIEIIKKGTIKKVRCKDCGCLFSYEKEDIQHKPSGGFNGCGCDYVICPQCEKEIVVDSILRGVR